MTSGKKTSLADDLLEIQLGANGVVTGSDMNAYGRSLKSLSVPFPGVASTQTTSGRSGRGEGVFGNLFFLLITPGMIPLWYILEPLDRWVSSDGAKRFFVYGGGVGGFFLSLDATVQSIGVAILSGFDCSDWLCSVLVSAFVLAAGACFGALFIRLIEGSITLIAILGGLVLSTGIYLGIAWMCYWIYVRIFSGDPIPLLESIFLLAGSQLGFYGAP